ncbi:RNA polymerase sigma-70 factor, ECF subfamily [Amycolatopsis xylanica]|uniref:RNA polymerase sigma-70 factor, ECF subfamily n=1 Tax=Amycolatopsis xylanica TaxID=589385 RepID=A0A1H3DCX4_9PSEU|nr:RNA polymerase sigma factor ShbA [Amycolatopsis xylanica]SDX64372.1 RNA polymerase sigma-70 factor, ECF subfamily [Amycolatopsis xylanica]
MTTSTTQTRPQTDRDPAKEEFERVVLAAARGDELARNQTLAAIQPMVLKYCRARIGGHHVSYLSAADVAQEVCIAVLKALPGYQDRGGSFTHLVYAIAANKVADAYRAASRDKSSPMPEIPETIGDMGEPESQALASDLRAQMGELLLTLPELQREILTLRIVVGLTAGETAQAVGLTSGHVRVLQHRALTKLRAQVSAENKWR